MCPAVVGDLAVHLGDQPGVRCVDLVDHELDVVAKILPVCVVGVVEVHVRSHQMNVIAKRIRGPHSASVVSVVAQYVPSVGSLE